MSRKKITLVAVAALCVTATAIGWKSTNVAARHRSARIRYEITVTNLTRGQIMSPTVVATHSPDMEPIFRVGSPASDEVAAVAEDAINDPLVAALSESPHVNAVATVFGERGPIFPGESASVEVEAASGFMQISAVGMLVTTNDAFYALSGQRGPFLGSRSHRVVAYDAGTEANNELCSHIPGPPCGNAEVRDTDGAEGYVHIHAGVHGIGDLDPAQHDWRNPVAQITIKRLRNRQ